MIENEDGNPEPWQILFATQLIFDYFMGTSDHGDLFPMADSERGKADMIRLIVPEILGDFPRTLRAQEILADGFRCHFHD